MIWIVFFRRLRLLEYFGSSEDTADYDPDEYANKFKESSTWTPPSGRDPHLGSFISALQQEVNEFAPPRYVKDNLNIEEREALRNLRHSTDIVIKPEDKGSSFVVMDKSEYIRTATAELSNSKFYVRESQNLNFQTELKVNAVVDLMYSEGEIDSNVAT